MKEKIEQTNFNEITLESATELLNELLTTDGDVLRENVITLIDTLDYAVINEEKLNPNVYVILNNEKIKNVMDELSKEYQD